MNAIALYRVQRGLSLIELMIGIVLGLLLMAAALQVLLSSKQSFGLQKESANMQENARFAVEMLSREIALAGFTGCRGGARVANVIAGSGGAGNWQYGTPGVEGFDNTQTATDFPDTYEVERFADTDSIIVRGGAGNALFATSSYAAPVFQFPAGSNIAGAFKAGDLVLASNSECKQVSIFQASAVTATTLTLATAGAPGNCTTVIAGGSASTPSTCAALSTSGPQMPAGSNVMPYSVSAFYVAPSTSDATIPALWRARVVTVGGAAQVRKEELVQGVESLQLLYGYDTNGDNLPNYFAKANDTALVGGTWDWSKVVSVRVAILLRSLVPAETTAMTNASFEGIAVPADRFARLRVFTTVQLKNHGFN
jgi:type IV pilus assembly protein PilW